MKLMTHKKLGENKILMIHNSHHLKKQLERDMLKLSEKSAKFYI